MSAERSRAASERQETVWCVDPDQTRHLQFLLGFPSDLGARAILRQHYECPEHAPTQVRLSSSDRPLATCINCDADLVLLSTSDPASSADEVRAKGQTGSATNDH